MKIVRSPGDRAFDVCNAILLTLAFLVVLYPLLFVVSASVSDPVMVNTGQVFLWPKGISFEGYKRVFAYQEVWTGYRNTLFYTGAGTLISLFVTFCCAYPLTRRDLVGRKFFMMLITVTMFFSGGLIPTYLAMRDMRLINTVWAVLLLTATSAYNIIVTRTFMESSIPDSIQEAAVIDGAGDIRTFVSVILPLSMPVLAVMTLFFGVARWNSYFNEMIYLNDQNLYPLQLRLREVLVQNQVSDILTAEAAEAFADQARIADVMKYALIIVSTLPILLVYPFLQRFFIKGVMVGAIKG